MSQPRPRRPFIPGPALTAALVVTLALAALAAVHVRPATAQSVDAPDMALPLGRSLPQPLRPMTTPTTTPSPGPLPDLVITADGIGGDCATKQHLLLLTVANQGAADAAPFLVSADGTPYHWDLPGGLKAGAQERLAMPIDWSAARELRFVADPDNEIAELDETNNSRLVSLPPSVPPVADCTVTPTPSNTPTPAPTSTPTPKPVWLPLLAMGLEKGQIPVPPDGFLPRSMARHLVLTQLDNKAPDNADAPDIPLVIEPGQTDGDGYLFVGRHPYSELSNQLWDSPLAKWLEISPPTEHFVFQAFGDADPRAAVLAQRSRIAAAMKAADLSEQAQAGWWERLHFITIDPLAATDRPDLDWWRTVLRDWGTNNPIAEVSWTTADGQREQLSIAAAGDAGWARPITDKAPMAGQLAATGNLGCNGMSPVQSLVGKVALVPRGTCNFVEKAANAARNGAIGLILFSDDRPKTQMAGSCGPCPGIPAMMIDKAPGVQLQTLLLAGTPVMVNGSSKRAPAHALAIDHNGRLREFGWIPYGFPDSPMDLLQQLAYEAQYFVFERHRDFWQETVPGTKIIPVYRNLEASDPGWSGRRYIAEFELPDAEALKQYDTLEVEMSLACPYGLDRQCGDWDYLVQLYLCDDPANPDRCDTEIVRWITAYKRGSHWITDISPVLSYLKAGGKQRVGFWTVQKYVVDMSFKLSDKNKTGLAAVERVPLFGGGAFVADYNDRYKPIDFTVPAGVQKVELVTVITGHGFAGDTKSCAEFCNHTHHFTVNGTENQIRHDNADEALPGTIFNYGCANLVSAGVVPNQFGTWPYARAGWCPGLDVPPKRIDITAQVKIGGEANTITYRGLYRGAPYVPELAPESTSFDARIDMTSYLVYYSARP